MRKKNGLTLIEMLIVVIIIGAISMVAIPRMNQSLDKAKERSCQANLDIINLQIESYYVNNDQYPADITVITQNTILFPDGIPVCSFGGVYSLSANNRTVCSHDDSAIDCGE